MTDKDKNKQGGGTKDDKPDEGKSNASTDDRKTDEFRERLARAERKWESQLEEERKRNETILEEMKVKYEEQQKKLRQALGVEPDEGDVDITEKFEAELSAVKAQMAKASEMQQMAAFRTAAHDAGIVSPEDAYVLAARDGAKIEIDDQGRVSGVEDAVKMLVEKRPWLLKQKSPGAVGTPTNPPLDEDKIDWTSAKDVAENAEAILRRAAHEASES